MSNWSQSEANGDWKATVYGGGCHWEQVNAAALFFSTDFEKNTAATKWTTSEAAGGVDRWGQCAIHLKESERKLMKNCLRFTDIMFPKCNLYLNHFQLNLILCVSRFWHYLRVAQLKELNQTLNELLKIRGNVDFLLFFRVFNWCFGAVTRLFSQGLINDDTNVPSFLKLKYQIQLNTYLIFFFSFGNCIVASYYLIIICLLPHLSMELIKKKQTKKHTIYNRL